MRLLGLFWQHQHSTRRKLLLDKLSQNWNQPSVPSPAGFDRAVAAAVCSHFQVPNVLQLGYGPVETLIAAAKEQGAAMTGAGTAEGPSSDSCSSCSVGAWAALAFGPSGMYCLLS